MKARHVIAVLVAGLTIINLRADDSALHQVWYHAIPPASDPEISGMTQARQEFPFMNDPNSAGYYGFLCIADQMLSRNYQSLLQDKWIYHYAQTVDQSFKSHPEYGDIMGKSPFSEDAYITDHPFLQLVKLYPWMKDPTSAQYGNFYAFASSFPTQNMTLGTMVAKYALARAYNPTVAVPAVAPTPWQAQHSLSVNDLLDEHAAQDAKEQQVRDEGNAGTAGNAAVRNAQMEAQREATLSAPQVNVQQTTRVNVQQTINGY